MVNVTFQVCVRGLRNVASIIPIYTPSLYSQGDVEQIFGYILHGVSGLDNETAQLLNASNLGRERFLVYGLPENEYFSKFLPLLGQ